MRALALLAGLAALAVAEALPDGDLRVHMVGHLLIATVAPALIALADPVRLAARVFPRRVVGRAVRATRSLTRPAVAVALASAVLLVFHLTSLLHAHGVLHGAEHAALFWSGLLVWISVLARRPNGVVALAALSIWMLPMAAIGAIWSMTGRDAAGQVMWFGGLAVVGPAALAVSLRALWAEEARQRRREAVR